MRSATRAGLDRTRLKLLDHLHAAAEHAGAKQLAQPHQPAAARLDQLFELQRGLMMRAALGLIMGELDQGLRYCASVVSMLIAGC